MSKASEKNLLYTVLIYLSYRIIYCVFWYFDNPEDSYGWLYLLTGLIIIVPLLVGLIFSSPSKEKINIKYWTILFIIILIIATVTDLLDKTIAQNYYTYESLEELKIYLIQNIKEKSYLNLGPIIDTLAFIFGTFLKNRYK